MSAVTERDLLTLTAKVIRPIPVLNREAAENLTTRQSEILDELTTRFDDGGFAHLTMAEIAAYVNCSLRTLYTLAASRDELVLIVVDRNLWRLGRGARKAIKADMAPIDAIRSYLRAANLAVANVTEDFARDCAAMPEAAALNQAHSSYVVAVTEALLNEAVRRGDIDRCNTAATAQVVAGLGRLFTDPTNIGRHRASPKKLADDMVDVILRGLEQGTRP